MSCRRCEDSSTVLQPPTWSRRQDNRYAFQDCPLNSILPLTPSSSTGALGEVLHSYIFSNSIEVFKTSYQVSLGANLMALLTDEADQDTRFLAAQQDFFFTADGDAPFDLTNEELQQFELRNDISEILSRADRAENPATRKLWKDRRAATIRTLTSLKLKSKRDDYFNELDSHRAHGLSTDLVRERAREQRSPRSLHPNEAAVVKFLDAGDTAGRNTKWMQLLIDCLRGAGSGAQAAQNRAFQCLLCRSQFSTPSSLSRHNETIHRDQFSQVFNCPSCSRHGRDVWITTRYNGREFTPAIAAKAILCFCGSKIGPRMFTNHLKRARHVGHIRCNMCEHPLTFKISMTGFVISEYIFQRLWIQDNMPALRGEPAASPMDKKGNATGSSQFEVIGGPIIN